MNNFIKKALIFIPAFCSVFTFFMVFKPNNHGLVFLFLTVSCVIAIAFYYSIMFSIDDKTINHFKGSIIEIGSNPLECSCGSHANMYIAENVESEEIKVIIQCSNDNCGKSVQGDSASQAERGWDALCGN